MVARIIAGVAALAIAGSFAGAASGADAEKCRSLGDLEQRLQGEGARPVARSISPTGKTLVTLWIADDGSWVLLGTAAGPKLCTDALIYGSDWTWEPYSPAGARPVTPAEAVAPLPRLRGLARRLAGQDADDLLQDVALEAVRYCGRIDPATHRGWLARVMYHQATRGRRFSPLDGLPEPVAADDPYWHVRLAEVDAFLDRMAGQDRAALLEAAEGKPPGDPRSYAAQRLARARRQLHAAFGEAA